MAEVERKGLLAANTKCSFSEFFSAFFAGDEAEG